MVSIGNAAALPNRQDRLSAMSGADVLEYVGILDITVGSHEIFHQRDAEDSITKSGQEPTMIANSSARKRFVHIKGHRDFI
jgi:hypothetical protein